MKKKLLLLILTQLPMVVIAVQAKTTYIPTYLSYLHIVTGSDTLAVTNNLDTLELADPEGMFVMRIDQEDVTSEKVKSIKRKKAAKGWMTFAAAMGGVSTAFSENALQYMVRSNFTLAAGRLASIYAADARDEQDLDIIVWIDNMTDGELMVCDVERGLTWWILPRQSMQLKLNNPEASQLRISDPQSRHVRYAAVLAGNKVTKYEIELETDEYWYSPVYREVNKPHDQDNLTHYIRISKRDYAELKMSIRDFWAVKKSRKK